MKVLHYNTHLFLGPGPAFDEYQDEIRLSNIVNRINSFDADIVGLNEVWADARKDEIINLVKRNYPFSFYQPNSVYGSGLLLLSKHRIVNPRFVEYKCLAGLDALADKGIISAKLLLHQDGSYTPFWVVITHAQSGESRDDVAARRAGLDQLYSVLRGLAYGSSPLLLFGDLNVIGEDAGHTTTEYLIMRRMFDSLGLSDLYRVVHPDAFAAPGFTYDPATNRLIAMFDPEAHTAVRLDYFFGRGLSTGFTCDVLTDYQYNDPLTSGFMDLSDHYPLCLGLT